MSLEKATRFILAVMLFLLLLHLMPILLSGSVQADIVAWFDHPDKIQLYWKNDIHPVSFQDNYARETRIYDPGQKFRAQIKLNNAVMQTVRFDSGNLPGRCRVYRLTLKRLFSKHLTLNAEEIHRRFKPISDDVVMELKSDYVEITSSIEDPHILSTGSLLQKPGYFASYFIPLLFASLFYKIANFRVFNMLSEVWAKKPSEGINFDALDGLRGIAALMVIADHTMGFFTGVGASGVWIFFGLSGFLLAKPFVQHPQSAISLQYMGIYVVKRLRRILPMYYTYIFVVFFLSSRYGDALRHFLFLQGIGHLWAIPQEMLFYLVAPFLFLIIYGLFKGKTLLTIPFIILLIGASNQLLHKGIISLVGMNFIHLPFFFGAFLSGVLFSYCHFGCYAELPSSNQFQKLSQFGFAILTIVLLLFFCLFSTGRIVGSTEIYAQSRFGWYGLLAGLFVWSVMASQTSIVSRLFTFIPLRVIGILGFSIYLIHPLVIEIIKKNSLLYFGYTVSGFGLFIMTVAVSYLFACITYRVIEVPGSYKHEIE